MAEPKDVELELYQKVWLLLEDYGPWTAEFKEGNRIRFDEPDQEDKGEQEKDALDDNDFPQAKLEHVSGTSQIFENDMTLGTYAEGGPCHYVERSTHVFRLTLTSSTLSFRENSKLGTLSRNAIRLGGPRLGGLDFVTKMSWSWRTQRLPHNPEDGTFRQQTTISLTVETEVDGELLEGS